MKLVYTHENRFFVHNAKNIIEAEGIHFCLKNEFAAGGAGDLAPQEAWLELWVMDDDLQGHASALIKNAFSGENSEHSSAWVCPHCKESNEATFDICWQCQTDPKIA